MKHKLFLLLVKMLPLISMAQVTISAQMPPAGFVQKDQLWNLILVNNKDAMLDISIRMNIQDAVSGQVVLSANSGSLFLGKGVKNINIRDIQPIQYNFSTPDMTNNYVPMGAYIVCYQLLGGGQKDVPLGEECIRMNIDPLSPPQLNMPPDKTEIPLAYPQFSWIPPAPFEMFSNLSYDLLVTEVMPGQSPSEAINNNSPVYFKTGLPNTTDAYPTAYQALDTGKLYAWNIVARNQQSYAAKSEVWTFRIKGIQKETSTASGEYFLLRDDIISQYSLQTGKLLIKYFSYSAGYDTEIIFSSPEIKNLKKEKKHIKNGDNYLEFDLGNQFKKNTLYTVSFKDGENKIHSLRFNIIK